MTNLLIDGLKSMRGKSETRTAGSVGVKDGNERGRGGCALGEKKQTCDCDYIDPNTRRKSERVLSVSDTGGAG